MDKLKQWVTLTVVAALAIAAAGWFLLVSPKRAEAADLRAQAEQQVAANAALETQLQVLKAQAQDLPKKQAELAAVAAKVPDNPALPSLIRALTEAASGAGVELFSISPGTPTLVNPAPAAAPTAAPAVDGEAAAAPAATAPPASPAGQLANIPLAININGDYFEVQQFVAALENLPRALRVNDLTIAPGSSPTHQGEVSETDGRHLTTTINGFVFMAANRAPATAVTLPGASGAPAAAAAPAAAPTAAPAN